MNWQDRIDNYGRVSGFPVCMAMGGDGRAFGIWNMGQSSTNHRYRVVCVFRRRDVE